MNPRPTWAAAIALVCALAACRSAPPQRQEYLLAADLPANDRGTAAPARPAERTPKLAALRVKPLVPRSFLAREAIAFREGDVRAGAYVYRQWSEPPAEAVTRLLVDRLRELGAFELVDGSAARPIGPFTLSGELLGLHEVADDDGGHPRGVAELELVLEIAASDPAAEPRRVLLHSRHEVAARDESMEALVRAIGTSLQQVLGELAPQIEAAAAAPAASAPR